jgi:TusA-related sulfurtransferase
MMTKLDETATDFTTDLTIDLRGEVCPHPVMLTLEQLAKMQAGQVLLVVADCPSALVNIPVEVVRHGHRLVGAPVRNGPDYRIAIKAAQ